MLFCDGGARRAVAGLPYRHGNSGNESLWELSRTVPLIREVTWARVAVLVATGKSDRQAGFGALGIVIEDPACGSLGRIRRPWRFRSGRYRDEVRGG